MRGLPQKQNARRADKIRLYGHLRRYKKIVKKTYIIYNEILKTCFRTAAEQLMKQYQVGWVVQGTCYNDLILYNDEQIEIRFPMMKPKEVQLKTFYSDAVKCKLVCEKEPNTGINSLVSNTYLSAA